MVPTANIREGKNRNKTINFSFNVSFIKKHNQANKKKDSSFWIDKAFEANKGKSWRYDEVERHFSTKPKIIPTSEES
jgi:hypothetical protein